MRKSKRPVVSRRKAEHLATMTAVLLVLIGGLTATAAWQRSDTNPSSAPASTPTPGPLQGVTILVDAGHGGYDGGAQCRDSGVWEKVLNLSVALETEKALQHLGASVVMTRREDIDLCTADRPATLTKKRQDMQNRIALAKENQADMVLSIHMNEYRARSESGPQVFYREGSSTGRLLAGCMQDALVNCLAPKKVRSPLPGDYFILQLEVPSVLIECGFVSNPAEEQLLLTTDYQARLGQVIAQGVQEYWRIRQQ